MRVIRGAIGLGEFVAFMGYLGMLTWPFIALGWVLSLIQRGEAAMARILEIRRIVPEIADPPEPIDAPPITGTIRFQDVRFRFGLDGPEVLCGIDETIPKGSTVAIIGRTGSGKSALLSLIPRLHDPSAGSVLLDGIDVRRRSLSSIRSMIAVVLQESFLSRTRRPTSL
jgi:ATP-binding cassette subfamily B protein